MPKNSTSKYLDTEELNDYINSYVDEGRPQASLGPDMVSTHTNGIEGLPYQFMDSVDRRIDGTDVGRKYTERIFSRMPLLFLTPCEPQFMDDFKKDDQNVMINQLLGNIESGADQLLKGSGKYYTVKSNYEEYYRVLNTMLGCLSRYMNIHNKKIIVGNRGNPVKIDKINWQNEMNDSFKSYFSAKENVIFYLDGLNSISQSFSNETTESSLAGAINGMSDQVNELTFLFGNNSRSLASKLRSSGEKLLSNVSAGLSSGGEALAGGIIGSIAENSPFLKGGKIIFPKIWSNSSFDQSYQLDIKLRSPDHDSLSIFLNVLKPYCKLLSMTLPRAMKNDDPNSYRTPYLVRASVKGVFSIDMGIITSLSVQKGDKCCWNDDGLPTQIDISLTIDDLYSSLHLSTLGKTVKSFAEMKLNKNDTVNGVLNNTAYMDFLANMAGINVVQDEVTRRIEMRTYLMSKSITDIPSNLGTMLDQTKSRWISTLWNLG